MPSVSVCLFVPQTEKGLVPVRGEGLIALVFSFSFQESCINGYVHFYFPSSADPVFPI